MKVPQFILAGAFAVLSATLGFASQTPPSQLLPAEFGGWRISGAAQRSGDPATADPVNAALLKEYGFGDLESANYIREDGRRLAIKAARFADASGAYGSFTYYKTPQMLVEKIGDQAASLGQRVLFYRGNILVDAVFQQLTAMSAAELRELSDTLPLPGGSTRNLPGLPAYLPKQSYVTNSAKYVVGPEGLEKTGAPIPAALVDFNAGAEVMLGKYNSSGGEATLMLIAYPTPQIAADHLRRIDANRAPNAQSSPNLLPADIGPVADKRTGPIIVIATGPLSSSEAKSLLASVNYDAAVTWNENTYMNPKDNIGTLVWNALILSGILILFALVIGIAFGGVRILLKKLAPDSVFSGERDVEFIALRIHESRSDPTEGKVSS